jgi:hypothetical protein
MQDPTPKKRLRLEHRPRPQKRRPDPGSDAQLARVVAEVTFARFIIEQCSAEEVKELTRRLPAIIDDMRTRRTTVELTAAPSSGGFIQ